MSKVAIIPARGGSKRIPRKNIKEFLGSPIISYSIKAALNSGMFDEVMVSTEDQEIASVAEQHGAKVPFFRSKEAADDHATTSEVLLEVINKYWEIGQSFSYACCIYPCAPLVSSKILEDAYNKLIDGGHSCVFPILPFSYPIWRSLKINDRQELEMNWPQHINARSQDLPVAYHDAGQFYFLNVPEFVRTKNILTGSVGGLLLDEMYAQDIDSESDWKMAELKYKMMYTK
ncbi:N-acylneuraminate cytidylyltransferase [Filimonas zeae]|uniref:Pseudaminic acid cytidylyltransferase n=1 Tax=Filimonas zeae TaxID=1737353 RepID=A0A917MYQ8_9BACT|nr:pseudaminic acid cytidylyltransferase [Filimonas zeae]MDR6341819.1 N-acylneuraminate cytidylyltransferase [Filimonas zeae]GGH80208.1 pseudaminic acid cytidylyltransferase [Filimonas zeae]